MTPHLVKRITDPSTNKAEDVPVEPAAVIPLKSRNVETVIAGMTDVSTKGTARFVFKGVPYTVACKTGTAQVVTIAQDDKYDAKKLAKKHHDHALFIAFAPARNPRIALAVLVENGGFGAQALPLPDSSSTTGSRARIRSSFRLRRAFPSSPSDATAEERF